MSRERSSIARRNGEWILALLNKLQSSIIKNRGSNEGLITIFVDNLPDAMVLGELHKMFAKFGVVKDVFIPRKRSRVDKELKVKSLDYARNQVRRTEARSSDVGRPVDQFYPIQHSVLEFSQHKDSYAQNCNNSKSYAEVVKRGGFPNEDLPSAKGREKRGLRLTKAPVGHFLWTGRSGEAYYRTPGRMVRWGSDKVTSSFWKGRPGVDQSAALEEKFGCPVMVSLFMHGILAPSTEMILMVRSKTFVIRIAEEHAIFICNSDFKYGGACHSREDEQMHSPLMDGDDDDVAEGGEDSLSGDRGIDSRSFIIESLDVREENREGEGPVHGPDKVETRGHVLIQDEEDNLEVYL
ncbi:hypothetical protein Dimus_030828 [Dionaea muscipula]